MVMTERLRLQGRVTITATTPDGDVIDEWVSSNTACTAGLNALVGAIAYAGVQDIASDISALSSPITPIYGAIGGPSTTQTFSCATVSGNTTVTPQVAGTFSNSLLGSSLTDLYGYTTGLTVVSVASDGSSIVLSGVPTTTSSSTLVTFTSGVTTLATIFCALDSTTSTVTPQVTNAFSGVSVGAVVSGSGFSTIGTTVTYVAADYSYVQVSVAPTVTSSSNNLVFALPGPVIANCNVISGNTSISAVSGTPFTGVGVGWAVSDAAPGGQGIIPAGTTVSSVGSGFTSVTLSAAPTGTYPTDSIVFSPSIPASSDVTLFNEFPTGTGRATAVAAANAPAGSSTNATFTWQFQFPINSTGSDIVVSEAGVFLLADEGAGDGALLNHTVLNPPATWGTGQMLTLSVSIGLSP
jgi:hypothetical protein